MRIRFTVAVILLTLLGGVSAGAEPQNGSERTRARELYRRGTTAFDLGRFDDAVRDYEAAYELTENPALLYNIAQAHRFAGRPEKALHFYHSYLRNLPNA